MCVFILTRRGAQVAPAFLKRTAYQRHILHPSRMLIHLLQNSRHGMCCLLFSLLQRERERERELLFKSAPSARPYANRRRSADDVLLLLRLACMWAVLKGPGRCTEWGDELLRPCGRLCMHSTLATPPGLLHRQHSPASPIGMALKQHGHALPARRTGREYCKLLVLGLETV